MKGKEGIFHAVKRWSQSAFACKETGTMNDDDDVHTAVIDEDKIEGWEGQGQDAQSYHILLGYV